MISKSMLLKGLMVYLVLALIVVCAVKFLKLRPTGTAYNLMLIFFAPIGYPLSYLYQTFLEDRRPGQPEGGYFNWK